MSFFTFNQNNSGGGFDYDESAGISHFVIIEADSAKEAVFEAEDIGLYFNGDGDCSCCGNRWSDWMDDEDQAEEPMIYGFPAETYMDQEFSHKWIKGFEGFIHYANGEIKGILK